LPFIPFALVNVHIGREDVRDARHDIESILWVLYYLLLRHLPSTKWDREAYNSIFHPRLWNNSDSYILDKQLVMSKTFTHNRIPGLPSTASDVHHFFKRFFALLAPRLYLYCVGHTYDHNEQEKFRARKYEHDAFIQMLNGITEGIDWPATQDISTNKPTATSADLKRKRETGRDS
jgi:hypothetical protein